MDLVTYANSVGGLTVENIHDFFCGWPNPPSRDTHLRILNQSEHVVLALAENGAVVGFVTALTDGILSASIPLLEVLPSYQGKGIAQELVRRMLAKLAHLYDRRCL